MEILRDLYPLRLAPVSPDTDAAAALLSKELPFKIHEYPCGSEHNGWVVPMDWHVVRAEIRKDGALLYDGLAHPLGVIGYSQSYCGRVGLEELKQHLYFTRKYPNSLVYHCDLYYKAGRKDWGFCVPWSWYNELEEGDYEVTLETIFNTGTMKVLEYTLPGASPDTIIINAHNCHAGQANDDISGIVVGMEAMRRLETMDRHYTYRLIVAPEHFGTVFYLAGLEESEHRRFKHGVFLEMLGNNKHFSLQKSFTGKDSIDRAAVHYLTMKYPDTFVDAFRKIIGNDETVWEAPGYEVPTISLSRFPYPEYHTDRDNEDIIHPERLEEAVKALLGIFRILETDGVMERHFKGLVALSHPRYDLYISTADPSMRPSVSTEQRSWNYLMDCLPRYFDSQTTILDICERHGLFHEDVYNYLLKFKDKGLVSLHRKTQPAVGRCWNEDDRVL